MNQILTKQIQLIYIPKVIPWGQTDKQTNRQTNKQTDGWTNIYSIFRDNLSLPHGILDMEQEQSVNKDRRAAAHEDEQVREAENEQ